MEESKSSFLEMLKIGDKGIVASLSVWGLLGLSLLAVIIALISACTGSSDEFRSPGF